MSERKLASIQKVLKVEPIEGADKIVKVTVLGWELVCKKDEVKVGDLGVYIEIDSVMPATEEYEFLKSRKYRIKTIELKKQVSQGLFLPLEVLPKDMRSKVKEGDDVTEILGVKKYLSKTEQDEINQANIITSSKKHSKLFKFLMKYKWFRNINGLFTKKKKSGDFPSFIKKTDENRIQLFPNICENHKDVVFQVTEKLDGQSFTGFVKKEKGWLPFLSKWYFGVCSRNNRLLHDNGSSWWTVAKQYNIKSILLDYCKKNNLNGAYIQGEICGYKIQGNKYKIDGYKLYVFNVASLFPKVTLDNIKVEEFCEEYNLLQVPILDNNFKLKESIPLNIEYSKGKSTIYDTLREGVVVRNYDLGLSFKIINPRFLLNEKDEE